jgi:hypothetical protein
VPVGRTGYLPAPSLVDGLGRDTVSPGARSPMVRIQNLSCGMAGGSSNAERDRDARHH